MNENRRTQGHLDKISEITKEELDNIFCELRGLLKENATFPELWDTDERLREWLKERGEL